MPERQLILSHPLGATRDILGVRMAGDMQCKVQSGTQDWQVAIACASESRLHTRWAGALALHTCTDASTFLRHSRQASRTHAVSDLDRYRSTSAKISSFRSTHTKPAGGSIACCPKPPVRRASHMATLAPLLSSCQGGRGTAKGPQPVSANLRLCMT